MFVFPKPSGHRPREGERPIFAILYQLWGATRGQRNFLWGEKQAGKWDDAVAGSRALRAGLMRALLDEAALENVLQTASVYIDPGNLHDSI